MSGYQLLCFGDYPAIIKDDREESRVKGEIYRVSDAVLAAIDLLEGDEYERITASVEVAGRTECVLLYVASPKLLRTKSYQRLSGDTWKGAPPSPNRAGQGEPGTG